MTHSSWHLRGVKLKHGLPSVPSRCDCKLGANLVQTERKINEKSVRGQVRKGCRQDGRSGMEGSIEFDAMILLYW